MTPLDVLYQTSGRWGFPTAFVLPGVDHTKRRLFLLVRKPYQTSIAALSQDKIKAEV